MKRNIITLCLAALLLVSLLAGCGATAPTDTELYDRNNSGLKYEVSV